MSAIAVANPCAPAKSVFELDLFCQAVIILILEGNQVTINKAGKEGCATNLLACHIFKCCDIPALPGRDGNVEYADQTTGVITCRWWHIRRTLQLDRIGRITFYLVCNDCAAIEVSFNVKKITRFKIRDREVLNDFCFIFQLGLCVNSHRNQWLPRNNTHRHCTRTRGNTVNEGADFYVTTTLLNLDSLQNTSGNRALNFNFITISKATRK